MKERIGFDEKGKQTTTREREETIHRGRKGRKGIRDSAG